jgi:hypothetical protein
MDASEYTFIKNKIEKAKTEKARAEGAKEKIESQLDKEYSISIEDVPARIKELSKSISNDTAKVDEKFIELQELTDWEKI